MVRVAAVVVVVVVVRAVAVVVAVVWHSGIRELMAAAQLLKGSAFAKKGHTRACLLVGTYTPKVAQLLSGNVRSQTPQVGAQEARGRQHPTRKRQQARHRRECHSLQPTRETQSRRMHERKSLDRHVEDQTIRGRPREPVGSREREHAISTTVTRMDKRRRRQHKNDCTLDRFFEYLSSLVSNFACVQAYVQACLRASAVHACVIQWRCDASDGVRGRCCLQTHTRIKFNDVLQQRLEPFPVDCGQPTECHGKSATSTAQ